MDTTTYRLIQDNSIIGYYGTLLFAYSASSGYSWKIEKIQHGKVLDTFIPSDFMDTMSY